MEKVYEKKINNHKSCRDLNVDKKMTFYKLSNKSLKKQTFNSKIKTSKSNYLSLFFKPNKKKNDTSMQEGNGTLTHSSKKEINEYETKLFKEAGDNINNAQLIEINKNKKNKNYIGKKSLSTRRKTNIIKYLKENEKFKEKPKQKFYFLNQFTESSIFDNKKKFDKLKSTKLVVNSTNYFHNIQKFELKKPDNKEKKNEIHQDSEGEIENNILSLLDKSFKKEKNILNTVYVSNKENNINEIKKSNKLRKNNNNNLSNFSGISVIKSKEINYYYNKKHDKDFEKKESIKKLSNKILPSQYQSKKEETKRKVSNTIKQKSNTNFIIYNNINNYKEEKNNEVQKDIRDKETEKNIGKSTSHTDSYKRKFNLKRCLNYFFKCCLAFD